MTNFKHPLLTIMAAVSVLALPAIALADDTAAADYPSRQIQLVVGFSPGGGTDMVARALSERLTKSWRQPVIVENRPGAGGNIASELIARANPDGYTLLMGTTNTHTLNPSFYGNLSFDTLQDFTPITAVAVTPMVLVVNADLPVNTVGEFIAYTKEKTDQVSIGSAGTGSAGHLAVEMFKVMTNAGLVHIPYKGAAPAITDLIGNQIPAMFAPAAPLLPHLKTSRVKALAVTTLERSPLMPEVPTLDESGVPGFNTNSWFGLFAPKGTPADVVDRIYGEVSKQLEEPAMRDLLLGQALTPVGNPPNEFAAQIREEKTRYSEILTAAGVKPQ